MPFNRGAIVCAIEWIHFQRIFFPSISVSFARWLVRSVQQVDRINANTHNSNIRSDKNIGCIGQENHSAKVLPFFCLFVPLKWVFHLIKGHHSTWWKKVWQQPTANTPLMCIYKLRFCFGRGDHESGHCLSLSCEWSVCALGAALTKFYPSLSGGYIY